MKNEFKARLGLSVSFMSLGVIMVITQKTSLGWIIVFFGVILLLQVNHLKKTISYEIVAKNDMFLTFVSEGKKIEAIKLCRTLTGCGLKEAHDYVESYF